MAVFVGFNLLNGLQFEFITFKTVTFKWKLYIFLYILERAIIQ